MPNVMPLRNTFHVNEPRLSSLHTPMVQEKHGPSSKLCVVILLLLAKPKQIHLDFDFLLCFIGDVTLLGREREETTSILRLRGKLHQV